MLEIDNIGVTVCARPHFMVFYEETTFRVMHLGTIRVTWWRPFCVCMAIETGFVITQVLGENRCSKAKGQHRNESCDGGGCENISCNNHGHSSSVVNGDRGQNKSILLNQF